MSPTPSTAAALDSPLLALLPESLHTASFFGLSRGQWLLLPVVVLGCIVVGVAFTRGIRRLLRHLTAKTALSWDDALLDRTKGPLRLLSSVGLFVVVVRLLVLPAQFEHWIDRGAAAVASGGVFWGLFRAIEIGASALSSSPWAAERPAALTLIPIGARVTRVVLVALAVGTGLSLVGVPVASIVAGLGVGGLAVALAAQKTFENLLGAFTIGVDQPFREGDFVKVDDFVGTVERVGLRSTTFRTLDRTVITLPNGQVAEKRLETFAARDRIRLFATLGLVYSTTSSQLRSVMAGLEEVLRAHPKIWPDAVIVRFAGFGQSSLDIEVMAWFQTTDFDEFCAIRSGVFIDFMGVVERAGSAFAFPTRTLHIETTPAARGSDMPGHSPPST